MPDGGKVYVRNGFIRNISGGESQKGYEEEEDEEELSSGGCLIHRSIREAISSTLATRSKRSTGGQRRRRDVSRLRQQCCARLAAPCDARLRTRVYTSLQSLIACGPFAVSAHNGG